MRGKSDLLITRVNKGGRVSPEVAIVVDFNGCNPSSFIELAIVAVPLFANPHDPEEHRNRTKRRDKSEEQQKYRKATSLGVGDQRGKTRDVVEEDATSEQESGKRADKKMLHQCSSYRVGPEKV